MSPYMKPMGLNGLRFNHRLAAARKAARKDAWARLAQRQEDLQVLQTVREVLVEGKPLLNVATRLGLMIAHRQLEDDFEVRERETSRLIGYVSFWGARSC